MPGGLPNFLAFNCKSVQSEAKTGLRALLTAEQQTFAQLGRHLAIPDLLANDDNLRRIVQGSAHYEFAVINSVGSDLIISAADSRRPVAILRKVPDIWHIRPDGTIRVDSNACSGDTSIEFWLRKLPWY